MKYRYTTLAIALAVLLCSNLAHAQDGKKWGHLKGRIIFTGEIPKVKKITPSKAEDRKYCEDNKIELINEDFLVDKKTKGLKGVFVMMYFGRKPENGKDIEYHESYKKRLKEKVIIDNNKLRFAPHSMIVMIGQEVVLRNSDTVGHNVRLAAGDNAFNANVPKSSDVSLKDTVKHAERLPQTLECNMHDWMRGRILVRHEPYAVVTNADGTFEIKNIPAGKHEFQFWQTKYLKLYQAGKEITGKRGVIKIEIKDGETLDLGTLEMKKR